MRFEVTSSEKMLPSAADPRREGYLDGLHLACEVLARQHGLGSGPELRDAHEHLLELRGLAAGGAQAPRSGEGEGASWARMWARALDGQTHLKQVNEELRHLIAELLACRRLEDRLKAADGRGDAVAVKELQTHLDGRSELAWNRAEDVVSLEPDQHLMFGRGARLTYRVETDQGDIHEVVVPRISMRQYSALLDLLNHPSRLDAHGTSGPEADAHTG